MDEKFKDILNQVNPNILTSQSIDLVEEDVLNSLSIMMLVSKLEAAYNLYIDVADIVPDNFESVEKIWDMVERCKIN